MKIENSSLTKGMKAHLLRNSPLALLLMAATLLAGYSAQAATVAWNWAGGDRNWSTVLNWTGGIPESTNAVIFGNTDAQAATTPVNTVDASVTVGALSYTNMNLGSYASYQNTLLASGQTLTVTSNLVVGVGNNTGYTSDPYTYATIVGAGGSLEVRGNVQIGQQSGGGGNYVRAVLDMRGLDNFSHSNSAGTFSIAGGAQRRQNGEVYLASTNSITVATISLGISNPGLGSNPGKLHLGQVNTLFADTVTVGRIVTANRVDFQTGLINPTIKIRGRDGVSGVANWYTGQNNQGNQSSSNASGTNDFSAGILDAVVTNLHIGYFSAGISTANRSAIGAFFIGPDSRNSLVVQNLTIGNVDFATATSYSSATGVFDAGGGTVTAGSVILAQQLGASVATGSLLLSNTTMTIAGNLTEGGGNSTISVTGGSLTVGGRIGAPTTANNVETMNLNSTTLGLTLVSPGDYTKASASVGTLNIDGAAASTTLKINDAAPAPGQYPLIAYNSMGGTIGFDGLKVQAGAGVTATLSNNISSYPYTIDVVITAASQLTWNGTPNGNWDIAATANWKRGAAAATYNETVGVGDRVVFDDTATGTTAVSLTTTLSPIGITVNNTSKNYSFDGTGKLSGAGGLTKQGTGTLTLSQTGTNDYAGTTYVGAGKLAIGTGGTAGMVGTGPLTIDGTVEFNRSDDLVLNNTISGVGSLTKLGANTLTLAGPANFSGTTTISGGTLSLNPAGTDTLSGMITGAGALGVNGAGTLLLSGSGSDYTGGTLITSGTLQIGDGVNPGSLPGRVVNNGTLVFNSSSYSSANNISGTGGVTAIGTSGYLQLSGVNTYSGPTTIKNGGTLTIGAANSMSPNSVLRLGDTSGISIGSADFSGYNVVVAGLAAGGNQTAPNLLTINYQTMTVNGDVNVGNTLSGSARANLAVYGTGASLIVNTNGGLIQLGLSTSGAGTGPNQVNCDLTLLDVFTANLGSTGLVRVGETNVNTGNAASLQVLRLAATSTITAGTIGIGNGGKIITPELHLGSVTNTLNANLIRLGSADGTGRDSGKLLFEGTTGSLRVRGFGGGATRANLSILVGNGGSANGSTNVLDVTGHFADMLIDALVIGDQASRASTWSNYFGFDQGVLDATSVSLSKAGLAGATNASLMHLGGGTVNFGSLAMASGNAAATLEITGGQVTVNGDITKTGSGTGTLQVANAALRVKGRLASTNNPMNTLTLDGATLSIGRLVGYGNPPSALAAAGSLSLSESCAIALTGNNYEVGQFPLISYAGSIGGAGFTAISTFTPPPGVSATLVDNAANQTIDVNITAAPPLGPKAILGVAAGAGAINLTWQDLGMTLQTNAVGVTSPTNWFVYPGSTTVTNLALPVSPATPQVFFRLLYP